MRKHRSHMYTPADRWLRLLSRSPKHSFLPFHISYILLSLSAHAPDLCSWTAPQSGLYAIAVSCFGVPLPGSPFAITATRPVPWAPNCRVSGDALSQAVARTTQSFAVRFRDKLGYTTHAVDLDVFVEAAVPSMGLITNAASLDGTPEEKEAQTTAAAAATAAPEASVAVAEEGGFTEGKQSKVIGNTAATPSRGKTNSKANTERTPTGKRKGASNSLVGSKGQRAQWAPSSADGDGESAASADEGEGGDGSSSLLVATSDGAGGSSPAHIKRRTLRVKAHRSLVIRTSEEVDSPQSALLTRRLQRLACFLVASDAPLRSNVISTPFLLHPSYDSPSFRVHCSVGVVKPGQFMTIVMEKKEQGRTRAMIVIGTVGDSEVAGRESGKALAAVAKEETKDTNTRRLVADQSGGEIGGETGGEAGGASGDGAGGSNDAEHSPPRSPSSPLLVSDVTGTNHGSSCESELSQSNDSSSSGCSVQAASSSAQEGRQTSSAPPMGQTMGW